MKPYYRILRLNHGRAPTVQHATLKDAETEALRLAGQHPGETFEILQCLGVARTTEPSIFWCDTVSDELPAPASAEHYPTTPLPEGFDRWVCRGEAWDPGVPKTYARYDLERGRFLPHSDRNCVPFGCAGIEYWEAVKDEPSYRMLEPGERIEEGDEMQIGDEWFPRTGTVGHRLDEDYAPTRRNISKP